MKQKAAQDEDYKEFVRELRMYLKRLAHRAKTRDTVAFGIAKAALERIDKFTGHDRQFDLLREGNRTCAPQTKSIRN